MRLTRRTFIGLGLPTMSWFVLAACGGNPEAIPSGVTPASPLNTPTPVVQVPAAPVQPTPTPVPKPNTPTAIAQAAATTVQPTPASKPNTPTTVVQAPAATVQLAPTPACGDADDVTIAQTAGPFFTPNSPERASLIEPGMPGTRLVVSGLVLTRDCRPVARALLDFWHADANGQYDNVGHKLRGHQFTDDSGRFRLETVVPGSYPGRARHIHVKAQAPSRPVLTTQLYFPNEPGNSRDSIFNSKLVMAVQDAEGGKNARFDFVLDLR